MVGREQRAHVLGIELLGLRREADEVGEEDGDDLALLPRGRGRAPERRAALVAEPRARTVLAGAGRAGGHRPSVRGGAAAFQTPRALR